MGVGEREVLEWAYTLRRRMCRWRSMRQAEKGVSRSNVQITAACNTLPAFGLLVAGCAAAPLASPPDPPAPPVPPVPDVGKVMPVPVGVGDAPVQGGVGDAPVPGVPGKLIACKSFMFTDVGSINWRDPPCALPPSITHCSFRDPTCTIIIQHCHNIKKSLAFDYRRIALKSFKDQN